MKMQVPRLRTATPTGSRATQNQLTTTTTTIRPVDED